MINGISVALKSQAATQYLGIAAQGAAMLAGKPVIALADGIHFLDNAATDEGVQIESWVKTVKTDFGDHARKRMRALYFRGKAKKLGITLSTEDTNLELEYVSSDGTLKQEEGYVQGQRSQLGAYWQIKVANEDGEDFSIDSLDALIVVRPMRTGRLPG